FLREKCPNKKRTPNDGAVNGIITGILLRIEYHPSLRAYVGLI
ncbi:MAG: hypothetical protein ACI90V_006896, partial [Bacillariaceae sp.]